MGTFQLSRIKYRGALFAICGLNFNQKDAVGCMNEGKILINVNICLFITYYTAHLSGCQIYVSAYVCTLMYLDKVIKPTAIKSPLFFRYFSYQFCWFRSGRINVIRVHLTYFIWKEGLTLEQITFYRYINTFNLLLVLFSFTANLHTFVLYTHNSAT